LTRDVSRISWQSLFFGGKTLSSVSAAGLSVTVQRFTVMCRTAGRRCCQTQGDQTSLIGKIAHCVAQPVFGQN
jgi:hypothetical protein